MARSCRPAVFILACCCCLPPPAFLSLTSQRTDACGHGGTLRRNNFLAVCSNLAGVQPAKAQSEDDFRLRREVPPLPGNYARDVASVADVIKTAAITTVRVNRRGDGEAAKQLRGLERQVEAKVKAYERDWLTTQQELRKLAAEDQYKLPEHPVFISMKDLIAKLQSGGSADLDMTSFRLDLSRQAASILKLTESAGVSG
mmetsp:Transcript_30711/g.57506  ORF Transcript_30711/g.57506 Transcript_30711/m.57506 type:complete len:200 (+) Transcript_30711:35-634(+)